MKFEVYCDEANPDVLTSKKPRARYLMIGSLWLPDHLRNELKVRITALRQRHHAWGEIKWSKVSPNRRDFYLDLVDLFFAYGDNLRFRCIAVDQTQLDLALYDNDEQTYCRGIIHTFDGIRTRLFRRHQIRACLLRKYREGWPQGSILDGTRATHRLDKGHVGTPTGYVVRGLE